MEHPDLRYKELAAFDKAMVELVREQNCLEQAFPYKKASNENDQILAFIRGTLLFVFNFNPSESFTGYGIEVDSGKYQLVLNTDDSRFGGFNRLQNNSIYYAKKGGKLISSAPVFLQMYIPSRTAIVFKKLEQKRIY